MVDINFINWFRSLTLAEQEKFYSIFNGMHKTPLDILKGLWNKYQEFQESQRDEITFEHYITGYVMFKVATVPEVHLWLAKQCDFTTTAEVRKAISHLKNKK